MIVCLLVLKCSIETQLTRLGWRMASWVPAPAMTMILATLRWFVVCFGRSVTGCGVGARLDCRTLRLSFAIGVSILLLLWVLMMHLWQLRKAKRLVVI